MTSWHLALQSFKHYLSVNLAIALGVAAATAVLTGALLVGDSMRTSLRDLTLDRLGETDALVVSRGFFSVDSFKPTAGEKVVPAILFNNGTVEVNSDDGSTVGRATNVNVFGVPAEFWQLDSSNLSVAQPKGGSVIVNLALAEQLGVEPESLTLRIPKPTQLPSESALGATRDLVESLVGLEVAQIVPNQGIANFNLHPSQLDSPNIFLPIELLQDALSRKALRHKTDSNQANVAFLGLDQSSAYTGELDREFLLGLCSDRSLEDDGLMLERVTQTFGENDQSDTVFDYWTLSSEQMVLAPPVVTAIKNTFPDAQPVSTYLANDIRKQDAESGIPFSMIAAIDVDDSFPLLDIDGNRINPLGEDEIVLNQWSAKNLGVAVGDKITVTWFDPETTHGKQTVQEATLTVSAIAALTEPAEPFEVLRRGEIIPAKFDSAPTLANDPNLTPAVPGVTDAESIENWDLPFETASKLRPADDTYWENHRTTPKAFVSFATGRKLWNSRFGNVTSFRIPADGAGDLIERRLLDSIATTDGASGFELIPLRKTALAASAGSTPFDVLFLALSMFVIASGLILVSLLFRLTLQSRASEVGVLQAAGIPAKNVAGVWVREMLLVCILGAALGIVIGIGYAAAMIWGLKTWWLGAISKPIINLHVGPVSIIVGFISGIVICVGTIFLALRSLRKQSVRGMLAGQIKESVAVNNKPKKWMSVAIVSMLVIAIILSVLAVGLSGDAQAGSFMGSGFCVLAALLMFVFSRLSNDNEANSATDLHQLSLMSLRRNPLRSTLTIGLVAVASFLIVAVSSFRLTPTEQGTAGFDYVAQSSQPIFADLNSTDGQNEMLGESLADTTRIFGFRFKPGEDASCNNLYQSTQPRVLGASQRFIDSFATDGPQFAWGGSIAETDSESSNPWTLLNRKYDDGAIPVIIDKNTANYSLKIFAPGGDYVVDFDSGESVTFRVVGFLSNTILQGSLLVSDENFVRAFPYLGGSRYFLIDSDDGEEASAKSVSVLEDQLGDEGFDAQSAPRLLKNFMSVQNTYLSTFQSLGALGLLLGTFGLAAVQVRNVLERRRELGLMRAVGFGKARLAKMILVENIWLLGAGLVVGVLAALCGTLPHYLFGEASVPWLALAGIFLAIFVIGLFASYLATRVLSRMNLLESLRA